MEMTRHTRNLETEQTKEAQVKDGENSFECNSYNLSLDAGTEFRLAQTMPLLMAVYSSCLLHTFETFQSM
jgi:hypothetical protein